MNESKQVIVMRKDLNMRKGKMIAQGAHASLKVFFDRGDTRRNGLPTDENPWMLEIKLTDQMNQWVEGRFKKICLAIDPTPKALGHAGAY